MIYDTEEKYYVYAWFYKDTKEIFYIGKGKNNRYKDKTNHRNQYFKNILNKEKNNVDVKFLYENLTEERAYELEKELIEQYWAINQCKANFHVGGRGGYTGNYNSPKRNKKISNFAKTRIGEKNPNYGHHMSEENKKKISEIHRGKTISDKQKAAIAKANSERVWSEESKKKLSNSLHKNNYTIFLDNKIVYQTDDYKSVLFFCKENYDMSNKIVNKLIKQDNWIPKLAKHKKYSTLKILKEEKCID